MEAILYESPNHRLQWRGLYTHPTLAEMTWQNIKDQPPEFGWLWGTVYIYIYSYCFIFIFGSSLRNAISWGHLQNLMMWRRLYDHKTPSGRKWFMFILEYISLIITLIPMIVLLLCWLSLTIEIYWNILFIGTLLFQYYFICMFTIIGFTTLPQCSRTYHGSTPSTYLLSQAQPQPLALCGARHAPWANASAVEAAPKRSWGGGCAWLAGSFMWFCSFVFSWCFCWYWMLKLYIESILNC